MANENKEETFYQLYFYLGGDCNTDFSELNDVTLRSKEVKKLAEKLKLVKDFRKNVFNASIFKCENRKFKGLIYSSSIEEIENWFKGVGVEL